MQPYRMLRICNAVIIYRRIYMKKVIVLVMFMVGLLVPALACEIEFEVSEKSQKEVYNVGDEIIVTVQVSFTHRVCSEGIDLTKFDADGVKVAQATKWREIKPGVWERKLKLEVIGNHSGDLSLTATRTCDKEGGFGSLEFKGVALD